MSELLLFCFFVSLFCVGLFTATNGQGMILIPLARYLTIHVSEFVRKPIFECLPCMSSIYAIIFWCVLMRANWFMLVPCIFVVCGLNTLFASLIKNLFNELEN